MSAHLIVRLNAFSGHSVLLPDGRFVNDLDEDAPLRIGGLLALGQLLEVRHASLPPLPLDSRIYRPVYEPTVFPGC